MVWMFMGDPKIVDTIQQRGIQHWFGAQSPRVVENFSRQTWVHQDRRARTLGYYTRVPNEVNFHFHWPQVSAESRCTTRLSSPGLSCRHALGSSFGSVLSTA